jgi:hypothetical protein
MAYDPTAGIEQTATPSTLRTRLARGRRNVPVPFDPIGIKHGIPSQNGYPLTEGLGNQEPIKRIFMIEGQLGETLEVICANPQDAEAISQRLPTLR